MKLNGATLQEDASRIPFSAHYRWLLQKQPRAWRPDAIRSARGLAEIAVHVQVGSPEYPDNPERARDFILIPDQQTLGAGPATLLRVLVERP